VAARDIHVGVHGERTGSAQLRRDAVRVDVGNERGLDGRSHCGCRFESELHLPTTRHERPAGGRCGCSEVLIGRRQPRHEAPELQLAEQLEDGGTVVCGPAGALELERHREIGDDRGELAAAQHLIFVRGERLA
jgi:hypothetical protein